MKESVRMLKISDEWKTTYPGAYVGILAMLKVYNPEHNTALEKCKEKLENELKACFSDYNRAAIKALPKMQAYNSYYKHFKKTYHVQLQLESVVLKEKSIPRVAALVDSMFMAELNNMLLTAGHNLESIQMPLSIDVAKGQERYIRINGNEQQLKQGDMMITDSLGVISSVLYGPDLRTRITSETRQVLFTVYAPPGIQEKEVETHLYDIQSNVLLFSPEAEVETLGVFGTNQSA